MTTTDKTIMVVDDSLTIRMQVKDLLCDEGYQVILAEDGETCLELLKNPNTGYYFAGYCDAWNQRSWGL